MLLFIAGLSVPSNKTWTFGKSGAAPALCISKHSLQHYFLQPSLNTTKTLFQHLDLPLISGTKDIWSAGIDSNGKKISRSCNSQWQKHNWMQRWKAHKYFILNTLFSSLVPFYILFCFLITPYILLFQYVLLTITNIF